MTVTALPRGIKISDPRPVPVRLAAPIITRLCLQDALPFDEPPLVAATTMSADSRQVVSSLVRSIAESLSGLRPAAQLGRWMSEEAQAEIWHRARMPEPLRPVRVHVQEPRAGALEVAAHLRGPGRSRALALRVERNASGRWLCVACQVG